MAIRTHKPTSPGKRHQVSVVLPDLSDKAPEKSLLRPLKKTGGRNAYGRITARHIGGGHKRKYRIIDWKRNKTGVPAKVTALEYDPNRSAHIALLTYLDGEKTYIIAPAGISVGDTLTAGADADIKPGNCLPMSSIPLGTIIHNVEMKIGKGAQIVRSAGTAAQLMAKEGEHVLVKLPSGEVRRFNSQFQIHRFPLHLYQNLIRPIQFYKPALDCMHIRQISDELFVLGIDHYNRWFQD